MDRIVVGNFVTASQAQRKWYTKVIASVASGGYRLGAVSFSFFLFFVVFVCGGGVFGWRRLIGCDLEFGEYYCAESVDGAVGRGEDAGVCEAWDSAFIQGTCTRIVPCSMLRSLT